MHSRGVIKPVLAVKTRSRWSLGLLLLCSASAHFLFFYVFFFVSVSLFFWSLCFSGLLPFLFSFFYTGDGSRGNCRVPVGCLVAVGVFFIGGLLCFRRKKMINGNEK